ncbi:transcription factor p65-like [Belonocnema kinseyi]|uniref:transcription factor p65-like n=1 Tax=Belonocnema kinseyi TaxID=2817044 RepID=UPI00143CD294|nr:transcription factor p65-like [Belonocnema kinseyi]
MASACEYEYPQRQPFRTKILPYVEVVEQPSSNTIRFRYECEKRSTGCIMGVNSSPKEKTYPSIKVHGYQGTAAILISCVTKDDPPKPHPHSLVGRDSCKNGVCSMKMNLDGNAVSFSHLAIQCVKKKQVRVALETRKREKVDPFATGFEHMDFPDTIDLNAVRLCFQVFIQGSDRKFSVPLKPVATTIIYDKKAVEEPVIHKLSHCSASVAGGMEMILLCGKVLKDDIQVRFFEMRDNWLFWDSYGEFSPTDVHKQTAIVFKTPKYCNQDIAEPVTVLVQLRKKSDGTTSKAVPFQMLPLDADDMSSIKRKRIKFDCEPKSYLLKQMQTQAERQANMSNHALLFNFMNPKHETNGRPLGGEIFPTPLSIYQDQASAHPVNLSYNNQAAQSSMGFNIPFNQHPQSGSRSQSRTEAPVPKPRLLSQGEVLSQAKLNSVAPRPQPRRRVEPPPPNVTMNSYAYREPMFSKYREQESRHYTNHSYNQQPQEDMDRGDLFELNDLPCNIDQLSPQDLAVLGNTNSDNISESLSENLSKGLSISDQQIQDTLQNIRELNKDVQAYQQHGNVNFSRNNENAAGSSFDAFPRQAFDNHVHPAHAAAELFS